MNNRFTPLIIIAAWLLSLTAWGQSNRQPDHRGYTVKVGDQVPDFTVTFTDGTQTKLSELKARVIMLQFTASWCSVCRREMPYIEREIWQVFQNKGLALIGIDRGEPRKKVTQFARDMQITYPLALDEDSRLFTLFAAKNAGVTRNVVLNQDRKILFLTRLFERQEFDRMKEVIAEELAPGAGQATPSGPRLEWRVEPGKSFFLSDGTTYDSGERFRVNNQHQLPPDMVVQGDSVLVKAVGKGLERAERIRWRLIQPRGQAKLTVDPDNQLTAHFTADGYGVNQIGLEAVIDGQRLTLQTEVFVEFSMDNMLVSKEDIPLPPDVERNPLVTPVDQQVTDHREQVTARNPRTDRLITMWQVKFGKGDACPMGVAVMVSDDHGITWENKRYLYLQAGDNSGWGSLCWNPAGNDGQGEFLLWTCSHVRSPGNRIMQFRSRDNGETWQHTGDYQAMIAKAFGVPDANLTYFGVNRMVRTSAGRLVAPMVCRHFSRTIWSHDNGQTWHAGNLDNSFPHGNEDAITETIEGNKLIFMARPPKGTNNRRFESVDGGKTWSAEKDSPLPTAVVNFGLDTIIEPGTPEHGRVVYSAAATHQGPHRGRQRLVVALNRDPMQVARDQWDVRLLWDASCNYSDVLYVPDDKSLLVTVETMRPGITSYSYAAIRYFKMSLRYWRSLPVYMPTAP